VENIFSRTKGCLSNMADRRDLARHCGRFCAKRCGPSRRRVRNASATLKGFRPRAQKRLFQHHPPEAAIQQLICSLLFAHQLRLTPFYAFPYQARTPFA
jgi:hypothetical protein